MPTFEFSSVLPAEFRQDVEQLLYFNPLQQVVRVGIVRSIERFGIPEVRTVQGWLQVSLDRTPEVQTLFALAVDGGTCELAGTAIYRREGQRMKILHLAVAEPFSTTSGTRGALAIRLVFAIRTIARRLNGVRGLELPYPTRGPRRSLPLHHMKECFAGAATVSSQLSPVALLAP